MVYLFIYGFFFSQLCFIFMKPSSFPQAVLGTIFSRLLVHIEHVYIMAISTLEQNWLHAFLPINSVFLEERYASVSIRNLTQLVLGRQSLMRGLAWLLTSERI